MYASAVQALNPPSAQGLLGRTNGPGGLCDKEADALEGNIAEMRISG